MSQRTFDFNELGQWPVNPIDQQRYIDRMKTLMTQAVSYFDSEAARSITLEQIFPPSQSEWESAWLLQSGQALPIASNARLLWWKTDTLEFGGEFGTVKGDETVYRRESLYPVGAIVLMAQNYLPILEDTMDWQIGNPNSYSLLPALSYTLPTACDVEVILKVEAVLASGTGAWGIDFLSDGVKIGTSELGIASNFGISGADGTGEVVVYHILTNIPAGAHTLQMIAGYFGAPATPPTFTIATDDAAYPQMAIRAVAL